MIFSLIHLLLKRFFSFRNRKQCILLHKAHPHKPEQRSLIIVVWRFQAVNYQFEQHIALWKSFEYLLQSKLPDLTAQNKQADGSA